MRLAHLLSDLRQIVGGFVAWLRYLVTADPVTLGLGQLSAESAVALRGRPNRYVVTITNASAEPEEVALTMDIYPLESPAHPDRHYAFFFRRLKARAQASTRIEIEYDWGSKASFVVDDDAPSLPDDLWRGSLDQATQYALSAVLLDRDGRRLELITIYQRLAP
jgi:hypothetical protein